MRKTILPREYILGGNEINLYYVISPLSYSKDTTFRYTPAVTKLQSEVI